MIDDWAPPIYLSDRVRIRVVFGSRLFWWRSSRVRVPFVQVAFGSRLSRWRSSRIRCVRSGGVRVAFVPVAFESGSGCVRSGCVRVAFVPVAFESGSGRVRSCGVRVAFVPVAFESCSFRSLWWRLGRKNIKTISTISLALKSTGSGRARVAFGSQKDMENRSAIKKQTSLLKSSHCLVCGLVYLFNNS